MISSATTSKSNNYTLLDFRFAQDTTEEAPSNKNHKIYADRNAPVPNILLCVPNAAAFQATI